MKLRGSSLVTVLAIGAAAAGAAQADNKSWAALKAKIPADAGVILSMDVSAARATPAFKPAVAAILDAAHDVKQGLDLIQQACGIDVTAVVSDVTVAMDVHEKHGLFAVGLIGLDEPKVAACFSKMAKSSGAKGEITSKKVGALTKYFVKGEPEDKDPLYAAWLAKDVLAIGFEPGKSADLDAALKGGAAKGELGGYVGKVDTKALAWGAGVIGEEHIKGGYGTAAYGKAAVAFDAHLIADAPDAAAKMRDEGKRELKSKADEAKQFPAVAALLKTIVIGGAGAEVIVDGSVKESDLNAKFLKDLDHVF